MNKPTPISDAVFSMQNGYEMVPYHVAQDLERRCAYLEAKLDDKHLLRAYALGQELSVICRELQGRLPEQFTDAIDQNINSLHDILNNFAGIRIHVFMEGKKCATDI